jgi:hypothetical protein
LLSSGIIKFEGFVNVPPSIVVLAEDGRFGKTCCLYLLYKNPEIFTFLRNADTSLLNCIVSNPGGLSISLCTAERLQISEQFVRLRRAVKLHEALSSAVQGRIDSCVAPVDPPVQLRVRNQCLLYNVKVVMNTSQHGSVGLAEQVRLRSD